MYGWNMWFHLLLFIPEKPFKFTNECHFYFINWFNVIRSTPRVLLLVITALTIVLVLLLSLYFFWHVLSKCNFEGWRALFTGVTSKKLLLSRISVIWLYIIYLIILYNILLSSAFMTKFLRHLYIDDIR